MTGWRYWLPWLVVCAAIPGAAAQPPTDDAARRERLVELERGWNDAFYRKDIAFIESLLADDFVATYDDGQQGDKARELELIATFNQRVLSATQDEFDVRFYGDTAVVRFVLTLVGLREGQEAELRLRFTDVWIHRDERWQCVSTHSTRITS